MGDSILARIISGVMAMLVAGTAFAGPIELPDSARPGAVRPEQEPVQEQEPEENLDQPRPAPSAVMEVPAVIDRPFDVDECPCTIVTQFRLLNAEDMPDYGVNLAEVQAILDESIQQQAAEGYSIGQLTEVASTVRNYYRAKGLILAQVVIPVQTVEGGVVDLELFVGRLGRVLTESNKLYSSEVLESAFGSLIGQPILKAEIEAALLRLTDFPGLTVFGVFQPGQLIGTADIVLKVQQEDRFDVAMRVDNHGTRETGQYRFRTVIDWNNLTDGADRLSLTIQQAYHPKNNVFKSFAYERYIGETFKGIFSYDKNDFDVGGEFRSANIEGQSKTYQLGLEKSFVRSRLHNLLGRISLYSEESTTTTAGAPTDKDKLTNLDFGIDYDSVDTFSFTETGGGINFASLDIIQGFNNFLGSMGGNADAQRLFDIGKGKQPSRRGGSGDFATGKYTKVFLSLTRLQTLIPGQNLLFRFEWQWSSDLLVPLEQYAVGGPDNVRSLPPAQVLWDRAFFYSFEWLINAPFIADQIAFENRKWGELLQLGIFYDFAVGRLNDPIPAVDQQGYNRFHALGLGLRFNLPGTIDSRLFWAWGKGGEEPGNKKRPQIWGDFTYSF